jgi:hypothetical protein
VASPFVGFEQFAVGDHIELLLVFTLDVLGAGFAQDVAERALVHRDADLLAGAGDDLEEQAQLAGNQVLLALLLDEVLCEADGSHMACG